MLRYLQRMPVSKHLTLECRQMKSALEARLLMGLQTLFNTSGKESTSRIPD